MDARGVDAYNADTNNADAHNVDAHNADTYNGDAYAHNEGDHEHLLMTSFMQFCHFAVAIVKRLLLFLVDELFIRFGL